ncbi:lysylphosphatidylglycerol synthase domain-containing protein [Mesorhizobium sp. BAC0120]|uniref:lysylphosphatidylglycerol synthase domain-containing protein n=1 Tax=Mesorhizobium sp. BAC0120 TaxID=3090670 RepID=UPI00298CAC6C|nr:lysylphosphatidylglycerol synthase domain-containing protein [Mesorhizobium sp. BAC0120]MDW6023155.1 lysylphosphatidylglycerol synthase domain-containing protein [Mesorhizobium sp. BAC0120]
MNDSTRIHPARGAAVKKYFWPAIGVVAVVLSLWLLYREVRGISLSDVYDGLAAIPPHRYALSLLGAVVAYTAIAGYDHIALVHLGRHVSLAFVSLCSFTTYALSHNLGGSVLSGAVIRYRAYATKGLSGPEIGILVAVCWFTFVLAMTFVGGLLLVFLPDFANRFSDSLPVSVSAATGIAGLVFVAVYVFGSALGLRPLSLGRVQLHYPRLSIVFAQLTVGPMEILGAAAILYFALPSEGNPGYLMVLGIFVVAFAIASISHAPGGLGVFEYVALAGLSDMNKVGVLAALVVFRLFYLIIPLIVAIMVVIGFERSQLNRATPPVG